jgi:phosphoglucosamine mutase
MMNGQEARLGGGHPGHIVDLHRHVTSDGLSAALAVCQALKGRTLAEAARSMPHYIQIEGVVPASEPLPLPVAAEIGALNRYLRNDTRVLARSSGTEPVIRLLAEAPTRSAAEGLYARLEAMVFSGLKG